MRIDRQQAFSGTVAADISVDKLENYLTDSIRGFAGPITISRFRGGQSNPTYKLTTPGGQYVLRRKPSGKLLPSAHAIEREFRVTQALHATGFPVVQPHLLCTDDTVIGSSFYVMNFAEGRVIWEPYAPSLPAADRAVIFDALNETMARLHLIDYTALGLADCGRPEGYVSRQIKRWSEQYRSSETEKIAAMDQLMEWLPGACPKDSGAAIVHGDFRLDNCVIHPTEPRIIAVLDWELSTIGHPLADFSYHCMSWHIAPGSFRGIGGLDLAALAIPSEADYVRRYCERTGRPDPQAVMADWNFYMAYNLFRMAGILQGIAKRVEAGTASSAQARQAGAGARPLAEMGWRIAQQS